MLRQYGVKPEDQRIGDKVAKGYDRADLHDAWQRYLSAVPGSATSATSATDSTENANDVADVADVAHENQGDVVDTDDYEARRPDLFVKDTA